MQRYPAIVLALLVAAAAALCAVEPGATREAVVEELGPPSGSANFGANTILFYDRGEVKLHDGRVVAVNLVSAEALAARRAAEEDAARRADEANQARLARLEAEGRTTFAAKKADARFNALPAADQLTYWRMFAARYPMISVDAEITPLLARVDHELRLREIEAANAARLAELEDRIDAANERAARAEREAQRDRYAYPAFPYRRHPGDPFFPSPQPRVKASPPVNPVDADRAEAMADYEEARRNAYNGGAAPKKDEPARGDRRDGDGRN